MTVETTTASILSALSRHELSESEIQQLNDIIRASLVDSIETTTDNHLKTTVHCCGPEADLAHQIRHEVNLKKKALIANLLGAR